MKKIQLKAPAKLNLFLDIVGKRDDGYHLLDNVMQTVDLFDIVTIETISESGIYITCTNDSVPCDEHNTAYKMAKEVLRYKKIEQGLKIHIEKNIPIEAGMGGGSADAAAVLNGLNKMLELNLSDEEKILIGEKIGADVPFIIFGGTAFTEGIGEIIHKVKPVRNCFFVIVKPSKSVNTGEAFRVIDKNNIMMNKDKQDILSAIKEKDNKKISKAMANIFELIVDSDIIKIKEKMYNLGALGSIMTGSGSAVFGIFEKKEKAEEAFLALKREYEKVFVCEPWEGEMVI